MENNARLQLLISKYLHNSLSEAEKTELFNYFDDPSFLTEIEDRFGLEFDRELGQDEMSVKHQENLLNQIFEFDASNEEHQIKKIKLWPRISIVAAVATIIVSAGILFYKVNNHRDATNLAVYINDIAPGKQGATLTLANGKKIRLVNVANGELAKEAGVTITKMASGQLIYEVKEGNAESNQINVLSTANGESYQLRLPDGSSVWLNAASTLKYPTSFVNLKNRSVELSGEGYFEVAKDKAHPFIVTTAKEEVKVLGTHFNINSYANEIATKTTLVEGSVLVSDLLGRQKKTLRPGEQSEVKGSAISITEVDTDDATAWKNGKFVFNSESIESVMRKLSRWYDVEVIYEADFKDRIFTGSISRRDNISKILNKIKLTKAINFKIEGRRVTVMQ